MAYNLNPTPQPMLNSLDTYRAAGALAGRARWHQDESVAREMSQWLRAAIALESPDDRKAARQAYNDGYRHGYGIIIPLEMRTPNQTNKI